MKCGFRCGGVPRIRCRVFRLPFAIRLAIKPKQLISLIEMYVLPFGEVKWGEALQSTAIEFSSSLPPKNNGLLWVFACELLSIMNFRIEINCLLSNSVRFHRPVRPQTPIDGVEWNGML